MSDERALRARAWRIPLLGLLLASLVVGASVALAYRNSVGLMRAVRWVEHTHEVIDLLDLQLEDVASLASLRRGYGLTGDATMLAPWDGLCANVRRREIDLLGMVADNPTQRRHAVALNAALETRVAQLDHALAHLRPGSVDREYERARVETGVQMDVQIRTSIDAMKSEERTLLRERTAVEQAGLRATGLTMLGGFSGAFVLVAGAFLLLRREVAERTRSELRLRASEVRLARILEATPDGIVIVDGSGTILQVNDRTVALTGYPRGELVGQCVDMLVPERLRARHAKHRTGYFKRPTTRSMGEGVGPLVARRRDGTEFPADISLGPIGAPEGMLAIAAIRDVSARVAADAELRTARDSAEAANRELEAFSYSVAHDLRAPLRSIDGFSQALLEDYGDRLDAEGRGYLDRARAAAQRMARLIDDLLALSRVTRTVLDRQPVDVTQLAREVVGRLREAEPERRVDVVVDEGLEAQADPRLVAILLENLIGNAWKFTARTADARIEVRADPSVDGVPGWRVRDNGAGFDMAYAARLFAPFQRLHSQDEFGGSGIGLATVQRIVQRHGGRLVAEGEVGRGATFRFTLSGSPPRGGHARHGMS